MFHFVHTYIPQTNFWDGLIKRGLINDASGVKMIQCDTIAPEHRFNVLASPGGRLHEIIQEANRPFFVDRLQGGTFLYPYQYDTNLIEYYDLLLGERFLGFQMHEWASNLLSDYHKIVGDFHSYENFDASTAAARRMEWTVSNIEQAVLSAFPDQDGRIYLEALTAEEWTAAPLLTDSGTMIAVLRELFRKRQASVDGHLLAADSCFMCSRLEYENGLRHSMPEIGAQAPFVRVQLALVRGMSKSRGIPFGAYQEPWGGTPFSCCYYKKDPPAQLVNEWNVTERENSAYGPAGENGGSSMSLLRRIFYYAFLAGAQFLAEEWGACNTFYDWNDFELTPYGQIKKELIDFAQKYPEPGDPYTPFAFVLPAEMKIVNLNQIAKGSNFYRFYEEFPLMEDQRIEQHVYDVLRMVYQRVDSRPEGHYDARAITNSEFGDLFDLVYEDDPGLFHRYAYLIDLTGGDAFLSRNREHSSRILPSDDLGRLHRELKGRIQTLPPIQVEGSPFWMLNKSSSRWIATFFNNEGVERTVATGEYTLPEAAIRVTATLPSPHTQIHVLVGDPASLKRDGRSLTFVLAPGDILIFSFLN